VTGSVLERVLRDLLAEFAEADSHGPRRIRQETRAGHAGNRVDLEHVHLVIRRDDHVDTGDSPAPERLKGGHRDTLALRLGGLAHPCRDDVHTHARLVLGLVVVELVFGNDLERGERKRIGRTKHADRRLGSGDELLDEDTIVVTERELDGGKKLIGVVDDRHTHRRTLTCRLHYDLFAKQCHYRGWVAGRTRAQRD